MAEYGDDPTIVLDVLDIRLRIGDGLEGHLGDGADRFGRLAGVARLVGLDDVGRDPAPVVDGQALLPGPDADLGRTLTVAGDTGALAGRRGGTRLAGRLDERRQAVAQPAGVGGAEIDLVGEAVQRESDALVRGPAIDVVDEFDDGLACHVCSLSGRAGCQSSGWASGCAAMNCWCTSSAIFPRALTSPPWAVSHCRTSALV